MCGSECTHAQYVRSKELWAPVIQCRNAALTSFLASQALVMLLPAYVRLRHLLWNWGEAPQMCIAFIIEPPKKECIGILEPQWSKWNRPQKWSQSDTALAFLLNTFVHRHLKFEPCLLTDYKNYADLVTGSHWGLSPSWFTAAGAVSVNFIWNLQHELAGNLHCEYVFLTSGMRPRADSVIYDQFPPPHSCPPLPITTHSVQSRSMGQVTHLWKVILCTGHSWTVWSQCNSKLLIEHIFLLYLTSWGWGWVQLKKSIEYWVDNHLWLEGSKKDPL